MFLTLAWVLGVVVLALAAYLLLWLVPIEPVAWTAGSHRGRIRVSARRGSRSGSGAPCGEPPRASTSPPARRPGACAWWEAKVTGAGRVLAARRVVG